MRPLPTLVVFFFLHFLRVSRASDTKENICTLDNRNSYGAGRGRAKVPAPLASTEVRDDS